MKLFTCEQVSKYHPDKVADQISDSLLDMILEKDTHSKVAIETMIKHPYVVVAGEVLCSKEITNDEIAQRVQKVVTDLNYEKPLVINMITKQSPEINRAVESDENIGAGDQGFMIGYATNETESKLPYGFEIANKIIKIIESEVVNPLNNGHGVLKGDAKCQVTVDLDELVNGHPVIDTILVSVCHVERIPLESIKEFIKNLLTKYGIPEAKNWIINPSGTWTIGGSEADCGLTGRKIVCDQYGGYTSVGGGAFSGKDPSKVDRTGAYMARYIAKKALKNFNLNDITIQLSYGIGISKPVSVSLDITLNNLLDICKKTYEQQIMNWINNNFDLTPKGMIKTLHLLDDKRPSYRKLAEGCHFYGRW